MTALVVYKWWEEAPSWSKAMLVSESQEQANASTAVPEGRLLSVAAVAITKRLWRTTAPPGATFPLQGGRKLKAV